LVSGAAGTGKSVACMYKIHLLCLQVPGVRALVVRKTHSSLTASTLVTFRQKVAAEALAAGVLRYYGGSGAEPAAFRYTNGSVLVVGGLDRPSRLLSTEYDVCFVDEAIEATAEDLDTLTTRLRNGRIPHQQLIMATNPGAPSHHLKQRADSGRCTILYSRHEDNPRLFANGEWTEYGLAYLARLDSLTGPRYLRMRKGLWAAAEGLVYADFDPAVHLVDALPAGSENWPRLYSVDFGFSNPFCCQFFAEDPDGRLWLYREIYRTKVLVEDHARHILSLVRKPLPGLGRAADPKHAADWVWTEPKPRAIVCDHDAEDRATLERHLGISTRPAKKTVSDGIQAMQVRFKVQVDGKPRIFFVRDATVERDPLLDEAKKPCSTIEELSGYVWPTDVKPDQREHPVKKDDHGCDAARYAVAERDLGARPGIRVMR
jgi:phage terminase large subunit